VGPILAALCTKVELQTTNTRASTQAETETPIMRSDLSLNN
jgi:hypothetical protein